ncbi:glycosyltransferase [Patescibacteria group bacterium]|nr:glycosyltransferase [Patescibacteria group bacterium]
MINCSGDEMSSEEIACSHCAQKYSLKNNCLSLIDKDIYWGEFSELELDNVIQMLEVGQNAEAKDYINKKLDRKDFIFSQMRSDFIYLMNLGKDKNCLDCGCGLGTHSYNMSRYVKHVFSFDLSSKRVRFCELRKKIDNRENISFMHSDLLVLNSAYEGMSHVLLEGIFMGIPIVTTTAGGNMELKKFTANYSLVSFGNSTELENTISKQLSDNEACASYSANIRIVFGEMEMIENIVIFLNK